MATIKSNDVGRAVNHYRKHLKLEAKVALSERELTRLVNGLDTEDMAEYIRLTTALDQAAAEADAYAEARNLTESTRWTYLGQALNSAGR